jgi:triosephosphate isomerase
VSERVPLVAANWKMHKTVGEADAFLDALLPRLEETSAEVIVCPPYTALSECVARCRGTAVRVAAQNMHQEAGGAFTGEVSAPMLVDLGVQGVILGHSERRRDFAETDEALRQKVPAAMAAGLQPILCVGETEEQRDAGETEAVLEAQVTADLAAVDDRALEEVVIAYEPVWAIGTGRTATAAQAQEAIAHIRALLANRDASGAARARILYGGSVKGENAGELMAQPDVDGALVGGASLDPEEFAVIVAAVA